jgi:antitoxin HicB
MTTIDELVDQAYTIELVPDRNDDGHDGWVAQVEELPGCISQGATPDEAVENLREARAAWIDAALEEGRDIPAPKALTRYSGRFLVRLPESLHAQLARLAEAEGTSLNQFVLAALSGAVGWRAPARRAEPAFIQLRREPEPAALDDVLIEELDLGVRSYNALKRAGIETVGDLVAKKSQDLEAMAKLSKTGIDEVVRTLDERDLRLADG